MGHELGATVRDDMVGSSMKCVDSVNERVSKLIGVQGTGWNEVAHLGESADDDKDMFVDRSVALAVW